MIEKTEGTAGPSRMSQPNPFEMSFELLVILVSDVDRSKSFYATMGWSCDIDFERGPGYRVVQLTPPRFEILNHLRQRVDCDYARIHGRDASDSFRYRSGSKQLD